MKSQDQELQFVDPGHLVDGELELVLAETQPGDPARGWVPVYVFEMRVGGRKAGGIKLRAGINATRVCPRSMAQKALEVYQSVRKR